MIVFRLDGNRIGSAADFHERFFDCPTVPGYYGANLSALRDTLTGIVELPLKIIWEHADASRAAMGEGFAMIVKVVREAEEETAGGRAGFTFELVD